LKNHWYSKFHRTELASLRRESEDLSRSIRAMPASSTHPGTDHYWHGIGIQRFSSEACMYQESATARSDSAEAYRDCEVTHRQDHESSTSSQANDHSAGCSCTADRTHSLNHARRHADTVSETSSPTKLERWLVGRLVRRFASHSLGVHLWGDELVEPGPASSLKIHILNRRALWRVLRHPEYYFLEEYSQGNVEVEGDLTELLVLVDRVLNTRNVPGAGFRTGRGQRRSLRDRRENIAHHYDLGNDFYRLWLDEQLLYTCAYYKNEGMTLEAAQVAKMDHVCRKLRLQPGEEVIEAGCGWGALAIHMARNYGVRVRAYNVSAEQVRYVRERVRREQLESQIEVVESDWARIEGTCDAFVSVGMLEHVAPVHYGELGALLRRCLRPEGRGLLHSIGMNRPWPLNPWIERRIFPGAQPPTLKQFMEIFEPFCLSVYDVENLRLHYAETCRHWLQRFESALGSIRAMFDETFVRAWRAYLAASIAAFESGGLQLYQVVFGPMESNNVPRNRAHLYLD
jgi:cyclopropane-fatty-acyl-phospholipid synthase